MISAVQLDRGLGDCGWRVVWPQRRSSVSVRLWLSRSPKPRFDRSAKGAVFSSVRAKYLGFSRHRPGCAAEIGQCAPNQ